MRASLSRSLKIDEEHAFFYEKTGGGTRSTGKELRCRI